MFVIPLLFITNGRWGKKPRQIYFSGKDASSALLNLTSNGSRSHIFGAVLASPFAVVPPPWPLQLPARPPGCGSQASRTVWQLLLRWMPPRAILTCSPRPEPPMPCGSQGSGFLWFSWAEMLFPHNKSTLWHFNFPEINSFRN